MKSEKFSLYQNDGIWGILEDATNDGTICVKSYFGADLIINRMNELAEQIRSLEEQLKNAIVPKFKFNQVVYFPSNLPVMFGGPIIELKVKGFIPDDYDLLLICEDNDKERFDLYQKSLFATREEAEKRLAELKGDTK